VKDKIDSELDTSPMQRGIALHEAARALVEGLQNGTSVELDSLVEGAQPWERQRWREVLEVFFEKEKDVRQKMLTKTLASEIELEWSFGELTLYGRADRIDETAKGELLVVDYKSGSQQPHGQDMVGQGYALQLPFYAVAARQHFKREVAGAQFVELNSTGSRARGIFFKSRVGSKAPGVAPIRSNSKSLVPGEPDEVWPTLENHLKEAAYVLMKGRHDAQPKDPSDCLRCSAAISCNALRRKSP
jgi:RecB family exonuclease